MANQKLGRGVIAKNSAGLLGFIVVDEPEEIDLGGEVALRWRGVQLQDRDAVTLSSNPPVTVDVKAGALWTSRDPEVIESLTHRVAHWSV